MIGDRGSDLMNGNRLSYCSFLCCQRMGGGYTRCKGVKISWRFQ